MDINKLSFNYRTSMAALSGSTAGILGLPTLYGFAFYVVSVVGKGLYLQKKILSIWISEINSVTK
jgi:hypothetical protein